MYMLKLDLGTFDVVSGKLTISDPGYKPGTWCMGELENVIPGMWHASAIIFDAGEWGRRVARLVVYHEEYPHSKNLIPREAPFEVGVDSGQAGFFDSVYYQNDSVLPCAPQRDFGGLWYSHCCEITLSRLHAGVLPYGAVSSSGFGDGGYVCRYWETPAGLIAKAEIVFIDKSEMEEYA